MCGRFALATPVHELARELEAEPLSDLTPFNPSWNVAPQTHVPVATDVGVDGQQDVPKHLRLM
ncbi:MAG: SOS response-associated peptidase family protein, partial [Poseidonia sp.]